MTDKKKVIIAFHKAEHFEGLRTRVGLLQLESSQPGQNAMICINGPNGAGHLRALIIREDQLSSIKLSDVLNEALMVFFHVTTKEECMKWLVSETGMPQEFPSINFAHNPGLANFELVNQWEKNLPDANEWLKLESAFSQKSRTEWQLRCLHEVWRLYRSDSITKEAMHACYQRYNLQAGFGQIPSIQRCFRQLRDDPSIEEFVNLRNAVFPEPPRE